MVSPFMAFAKGAFEGYNDIQEEKRALAAEMALETHKANIANQASGDDLPWFTVSGDNGNTHNLFRLTEPSTGSEKERLGNNINLIVRNLSMENLEILRDIHGETAYNNAINQGTRYLHTWFRTNTNYADDNSTTIPPNVMELTGVMNHPIFSKNLLDIGTGSYNPSINNSNNVSVSTVGNELRLTNLDKVVQSGDLGSMHIQDRNTQQWIDEPITMANIEGYIKDVRKINGDTSIRSNSTSQYITKYRYVIPFVNSPLIDHTTGQPLPPDRYGRVPRVHDALLDIHNSPFPNEFKIYDLQATQQHWNNTHDERSQINSGRMFEAFDMFAQRAHVMDNPAGGQPIFLRDGQAYLTKIVGEDDIKSYAVRERAAREVVMTSTNMLNNIYGYWEEHKRMPPINPIAAGFVETIAGFTGKGNFITQITGVFTSNKQDGIDTVGKERNNLSRLAELADEEARNNYDADGNLLEGATFAANHNFLNRMLAYQLAVAIQGGTGGRTVSDQDVDNMMNALGTKLFANGIVQKNVLQTVRAFANDIVKKNQIWRKAGQSVNYGKAAQAMDKYNFARNSKDPFFATRLAGEDLKLKLADVTLEDGPIGKYKSITTGNEYPKTSDGFFDFLNDITPIRDEKQLGKFEKDRIKNLLIQFNIPEKDHEGLMEGYYKNE